MVLITQTLHTSCKIIKMIIVSIPNGRKEALPCAGWKLWNKVQACEKNRMEMTHAWPANYSYDAGMLPTKPYSIMRPKLRENQELCRLFLIPFPRYLWFIYLFFSALRFMLISLNLQNKEMLAKGTKRGREREREREREEVFFFLSFFSEAKKSVVQWKLKATRQSGQEARAAG